jgi:DNA-binding response OmpR family regulator
MTENTQAVTGTEIVIDPERFLVFKDGKPIILTKTEFQLFYLLFNGGGKVFSRDQISKLIWGRDSLNFPRTIDVHICNIRKKIGRIGDEDIIVVLKGVGYSLNYRFSTPQTNSYTRNAVLTQT